MLKNLRFIQFSIGLAFLILVSLQVMGVSVHAQSDTAYETVVFVPKDNNGIHYAGENIDEMLAWGPTAFTVAPDGSFWLADAVANRLLHFSAKGKFLNTINLEEHYIVGVGDLEVSDTSIWLLDIAAIVPTIIQLSLNGDLLSTYELPEGLQLENGVTGFALGEQGEVIVEREGGIFLTVLINAKGELATASLPGYVYNGHLYTAHPANLNTEVTSQGNIVIDGKPTQVTVNHTLGSLRVLGASSKDSFYVVSEEVIITPVIQVDQVINHYDNNGKLLGMSRVPISTQYTHVLNGLAVGPDNEVYALLTRPEGVYIARMKFTEQLDPILPSNAEQEYLNSKNMRRQIPEDDLNLEAESCRSRNSIISSALNYRYYGKNLTSTNVDGSCSGRGKPRYLNGAGYYSSVPYDWGGFDTVNRFKNKMNSGYQAGDIDTYNPTSSYGSETCSRGVDCSGFVSRVWNEGRYYTWSIHNISYQLSSNNNLLKGDILNKPGDHVVLFNRFSGNGVCVFEATTYGWWDRVVSPCFGSWTRFDNYVPRRYNNVCLP